MNYFQLILSLRSFDFQLDAIQHFSDSSVNFNLNSVNFFIIKRISVQQNIHINHHFGCHPCNTRNRPHETFPKNQWHQVLKSTVYSLNIKQWTVEIIFQENVLKTCSKCTKSFAYIMFLFMWRCRRRRKIVLGEICTWSRFTFFEILTLCSCADCILPLGVIDDSSQVSVRIMTLFRLWWQE